MLGKLNRRLKGTGDTEPEQAILRLAIAFVLVIYFCLPWGADERFAVILQSTSNLIILGATSIALLIFAAIIRNPRPSPTRRVCGILLDMVALSIVMYWTAGDHVPAFVFYLWVTLGNGFRYGTRYLYISYGVSLIGFGVVILKSEYWQEHQTFAISLLLILLMLPLYAAFLLKKLHAAIASAKQANEAKSRFLANMSHELRTPLSGVIGMGDLLRETRLSPEQQELVGTLHSSAYSLLELIENVLDIAKIEAGKISIELRPLDLYALVNSVIYMLSPSGESKNLLISCSIDPDTPFALKGDHQHLRQVLINLVNNAIKFTDEGSVSLRVFRVGGDDAKPRIRFEVVDTGVGMPEEFLATIFDDFTQAHHKSERSYGGTGLGTAISRELVVLMGGEIGVESELEKGSCFWLELPFEALPHNERAIASNHILLLASEETATHIKPALKSWSIDFDWVQSPARAIAQMLQAAEQGNQFHSAIVDQNCLTSIDAEQFAHMVRAEPLLENLSLILVNSSDTMVNVNLIHQYYISTILEPNEKRTLFNAIHAAHSVNCTDENVVTLAEHYGRQSGARALNILVAEDNPVNQQVIQGILRHAGHGVHIAESGEQVLDTLDEDFDAVDLLILDMNMPAMNGLEVVKAVRFMDTSHSLPVLMLTADATPEARAACIDAGADAFFTKPINARALLDRIASISRDIVKENSTPPSIAFDKGMEATAVDVSSWYEESVLRELSALGDFHFLDNLVQNFHRDGMKQIKRVKASIDNDIGGDEIRIMATEVEDAFLATSAALSNVTEQSIARH
jgi:two-component system sensor histidine kinase RpfC